MPAIPDYNRKGGYAGWEFISRPEYDWSGRTVVGQCFSQEKPDTVVFRPGTIGMRLVNCNIDNCLIPPGNSVQGECSQRRFFIQNDLRDWEVDAQDKPTKVLNEKYWKVIARKSVDPADIPAQPLTHVDQIKDVLVQIPAPVVVEGK